jgi:thiamine-monophosphate kinase
MLKESEIIRQIASLFERPEQFQDDVYIHDTSVCTTDLLVEGTHFSWDYFQPYDLGWKAAAVNMSDIAACGGTPQHMLVSIGVPDCSDLLPRVIDFYSGLKAAIAGTGCQVVGGDTTRSPVWVVNIAVYGQRPANTLGTRAQAKPGDQVIATGFHGLSTVGLAVLTGRLEGFPAAVSRHLRPVPQLALGQSLMELDVSHLALMDTSDGLCEAVMTLARTSGVGIDLFEDCIPLHPEVQEWARQTDQDPLDLALYGGEDFELLATIPPNCPVPSGFHRLGRVSEAMAGQTRLFVTEHATEWNVLRPEAIFQHFVLDV